MTENYKELSQIDEKYRPEINLGDKTLCIDTEDYIALYNLAEYGELLMREQEERNEQAIKLAISYFNQDEHQEGMKILQNALRYVEETECD